MAKHLFSEKQISSIVRDHRLGLTVSEILRKYSEDPATVGDESISGDRVRESFADENRDLRSFLKGLLTAMAERTKGLAEPDVSLPNHSWISTGSPQREKMHEPISSLLQRSAIIPAIRGPEYIQRALASPSVIVWLLYGTPLTLPDIVRQVRSAGKLPVANLDLLTGFAQDSDGIDLLAAEGIAGVVSTRQSVLRAARAQGMIAVQRTFVVDSIAVGNIVRALQHFLPDAVELLPAAAAPLCVATLRKAQPQLPIIATGLITTMRQVDDLIRCGVSSAATSDVSLWVL